MKQIDIHQLKEMTGEGLVLQGCGGDPNEWVTGINEMLTEEGILLDGDTFKDIYVFNHEGLTNMLFCMEDVNVNMGKLAMWRLQSHDTFGGTWLSDYLSNKLGIDKNNSAPEEDAPPIVAFGERPSPYRDDFHSDGPHASDVENTLPFQAYIENTSKPELGGFTIPLPTTPEKLRPFLEGIELTSAEKMRVMEVNSDIEGLGKAINAALENTSLPTMLDELGYLATKISDLHPLDYEKYAAALEAKLHCGSVAEMINLADNIAHFELQPAFNAEQYGEFLIEAEKDGSSPVFEKLEKSEFSDERALAAYILKLEANVDAAAYGRSIAAEENGVFTSRGYIADRSEFKTLYRGAEDIPAEWCVLDTIPRSQINEREPVKVCETDLTALLLEMHAVGGDYMRDAKYNLNALATKGDDFFVMAHPRMLIVSSADLVFRRDTHEHELWRDFGQLPDAQTFVMSVADREGGRIMGNLFEADLSALQSYVRDFNITFTHLDANMKDGTSRRITLEEWNGMDRLAREQMKSWTKHYDPADEERLNKYVGVLRWAVGENREPVAVREFLPQFNEPYMARANHPQPDMLRVTPEAAKEILAQSAAEVFRLMPGNMEKLAPIDAIKVPVYQSFREFAIRRDDCTGLEKWALRASSDLLRQSERAAPDKAKNKGEEL